MNFSLEKLLVVIHDPRGHGGQDAGQGLLSGNIGMDHGSPLEIPGNPDHILLDSFQSLFFKASVLIVDIRPSFRKKADRVIRQDRNFTDINPVVHMGDDKAFIMDFCNKALQANRIKTVLFQVSAGKIMVTISPDAGTLSVIIL